MQISLDKNSRRKAGKCSRKQYQVANKKKKTSTTQFASQKASNFA